MGRGPPPPKNPPSSSDPSRDRLTNRPSRFEASENIIQFTRFHQKLPKHIIFTIHFQLFRSFPRFHLEPYLASYKTTFRFLSFLAWGPFLSFGPLMAPFDKPATANRSHREYLIFISGSKSQVSYVLCHTFSSFSDYPTFPFGAIFAKL